MRLVRCIILMIFLTAVYSLNVYAAASVGIYPFGGTSSAKAGFTAVILGVLSGDRIVIKVSDSSNVVVGEFTETLDRPVLDSSFYFEEFKSSGSYKFETYVNGELIDTQNRSIYESSGADDGKNAGRLNIVFDKTKYTVGEDATMKITLTGIEENAYGNATFFVSGSELQVVTVTGEIKDRRVEVETTFKITSLDMKSVNTEASWGQRGYTTRLTVPINSGPSSTTQPTNNTQKYRLDISANSGGSVSSSGGSYSENEKIRIKASPSSGYRFDKWVIGSGGSVEDLYDYDTYFTMPARNTKVTATFIKTNSDYRLTVKAGTGGTVNTSANGYYTNGERVDVSATAKSGYKFVRWSASEGGTIADATRASTTFTMPRNDVILTAEFESAGHTLTVTAQQGGTIPSPVPSGTYSSGTAVTIQAEAKSGYRFNGWTSSNGGTFQNAMLASTEFTMPDADTTVTAKFEKSGYLLITKTEGQGTVTGGGQYSNGQTVSISATPQNGSMFAGWVVESGDISIVNVKEGNTTFTMPERDVVLVAKFTPSNFTLNITTEGQGSTSGAGQYASGETVSLGVSPASGWVFDTWKVESGVVTLNVGEDGKCSIEMPETDVTLVAVFKQAEVPLTSQKPYKGGVNLVKTGDNAVALSVSSACIFAVICVFVYMRKNRRTRK